MKQNFEKAIICLAIVERRIYVLSGRFFLDMKANPQFTASELDTVTDLMYDFLSKPNFGIDLSRTAFYRPLQRRFADVKPAELKQLIAQTLAELEPLIGPKQFSLTDNKNLWIIKPGAQSRGRGIEIHSDLDEMMQRIRISGLKIWVV